MSKIKMRCTTCGKWFQSANAKEVTCPECMQKARKEKMAAKTAPPTSNKVAGSPAQGTDIPTRPAAPPKPKSAGSGTNQWLDRLEDVKVAEPDKPPRPKLPFSPAPRENRSGTERPDYHSSGPRDTRDHRDEREPRNYRDPNSRQDEYSPKGYREGTRYGPSAYRVGDISGTLGQRPRQPMEPGFPRGPRPPQRPGEPRPERPRGGPGFKRPSNTAKTLKPPTPPKPKREKIPPPEPFKPTEEQIAQVEARYLELAVPAEFDGIRTQISKELGIPKKAVKDIVKQLRDRQEIPSWWELQTYKGDSEELAKIKAIYEPHLPLPPVGIHKQIAEQLSLLPGTVYQAIKQIRLDMNLPQYNDPALHGLELHPKGKQKDEAAPAESPEAEKIEPAEKPVTGEDGTKSVDTETTGTVTVAVQSDEIMSS